MAVKLTDVAKRAGVSPTTVSRVINNYGSLSQKTIDKVKLAMKELNYQPNSLARSLQGKNTQLIGLIFPTVAHPFFGELVAKLETALFQKGYRTILCDSAEDPEKEREYLNMLAANKVDGIIAGAHNLGIKEYEELELPIISFDRYLADGIPIVGSDNFHGGYLAAQHLHQRGASAPVILSGSVTSDSPTDRRGDGFTAYLKEYDIETKLFPIDTLGASPAINAVLIKQLLANEDFDGIFCTDDLTALLVWNQAQELGIKIPEELRLIGYDGTALIRNYLPQLTTIAQPISDQATLLVDLLLQRINEPEKMLQPNYLLPVHLIQGKTS